MLADGDSCEDCVSASNDDRIRYVHIAQANTIGAKRNFGSELAHGDIVASWDDDDWSAAGRLKDQINRLLEAGKAVTGYHSMLFTDGRQWWKYNGRQRANLGTSLCYRRAWWKDHRFKPKQVHEDGDFIGEAYRLKHYIAADAGLLMVASIHSGNSSPRMLTGDEWEKLHKAPVIMGYE